MNIGALSSAVMPGFATTGASAVASAGLPPAPSTYPPNNTIYINNLNEKIKRDELKKSLYAVFVQFGQILDILIGKSLKMRGQSFVVFSDLTSAINASRAMQGFPLYEKPMRINFAKRNSDVIAKREGTFVERPKRSTAAPPPPPPPILDADPAALLSDPSLIGGSSARAIRRRQQRLAALAASAATAAKSEGSSVPPPPPPALPVAPRVAAPVPPPPPSLANTPDQPPNKILFLANLPPDTTEAMLNHLFSHYIGYREVRMVPARHDIAFVEFVNEMEAGTAKLGLQGYNLRPGHPLRITFAKK